MIGGVRKKGCRNSGSPTPSVVPAGCVAAFSLQRDIEHIFIAQHTGQFVLGVRLAAGVKLSFQRNTSLRPSSTPDLLLDPPGKHNIDTTNWVGDVTMAGSPMA